MRIPLFPLNTVLYPGGPLKLRIFEPRYLEMISDCLRSDCGFGVCLIRDGAEVGSAAIPENVGTLARIVDWEQRRDGLLGITIVGTQRFRLREHAVNAHQLLMGESEPLPEPEPIQLPAQFAPLQALLQRIIEQLDGPYRDLTANYEDSCWVGYRLAEILPLPLRAKQELLELQDPLERLEMIHRLIER
jgi:uncharacterized protein